MLAPNSSASGPPGAKLGRGSSRAIGVSLVFVAGGAHAPTHTSSTSGHTRSRTCAVSSRRAIGFSCLPRRPLRRVPRRALPSSASRCRGLRNDEIDLETDQFVGEVGKPLGSPLGEPPLNGDGLALGITVLAHPFQERLAVLLEQRRGTGQHR